MGLNIGSSAAAAVYVGGTPATAVYLGGTQVWAAPITAKETIYSAVAILTYTIPVGARGLDIICLGGGGGGQGGGAGMSDGEGGAASKWASSTVTVTPALWGTVLTITVGAGGVAGQGPLKGVGGPGGPSSVSGAGITTVTSAGGAAGTSGAAGGLPAGEAVPNLSYNGRTYLGGTATVASDPPKAASNPGSGGHGGKGNLMGGGHASPGGMGRVWLWVY